jgi:isopropylmalate/homocitrate/citramalate synthase
VEITRLMLDAGMVSFSPGFPAVSEQEREAARAIYALGGIAAQQFAFCRAVRGDIDVAMQCGYGGVGMFIPISDSHLVYKMGIDADGAYAKMIDGIKLARSYGLKVRFGFEDMSRAPLERLKRFVGGAIETGVAGIGLADTVGVLTPLTTYALVKEVKAIVGDVPIFAHFHDDLGMATANSLMGCIAGATYVMGTFNGLGERAGNTCHEEIAVALKVRYGVDVGVDLGKLTALARRVSELARFPIAPNKPILGANVFSHETGIHVHGLMHERTTYEPFPPEMVGAEHQIKFGKHSGLSSVHYLARWAGIEASEPAMLAALEEIKDLGTRGQAPSLVEAAEILRAAMHRTAIRSAGGDR